MAKIIKHTFELPNIYLDDSGELVEGITTKETLTFTLLHRGVGIYEEMANSSLLSDIIAMEKQSERETVLSLLDRRFILNLAAASYVKIENGKFHNNRATAEEFKKSPYANMVTDMFFVNKLLEMATDCLVGNTDGIKKKASKPKK